MKIPNGLYNWVVTQNHNLPMIALVTFGFPKVFMRSIYNHNSSRNLYGDKKACVTLSFDCDYPDDAIALPQVTELLDGYDFKASFAVVGHWLEKYTKEHESIVHGKHEVMNHTYSHPDNEMLNPGRKFREISREEKTEEVTKCHELCESLLGVSPTGFRVPHFKHLFSNDIYGILKDVGYTYSSSTWLTNTTSYGLPYVADEGIIEFPLSTCPSHPFTVFDTWHSLNPERVVHKIKHCGVESYLALFKELIEMGKATGSYINIYMDPLDIPKMKHFKDMLDIMANADLDVVTYEEYLKRNMHIETTAKQFATA